MSNSYQLDGERVELSTSASYQIDGYRAIDGAFIPYFIGSPLQGLVDFIGLDAALSSGIIAAPTQGTITFTGLLPDLLLGYFIGTPAQGVINFTGSVSGLSAGLSAAPNQGTITFTGLLTTSASFLTIGTPLQGTITFTGGTASLIVGFAGQPATGTIAVVGQVPSLIAGIIATPLIRLITLTGQTAVGVYTPTEGPIDASPVLWLSNYFILTLTGAPDSLPDLDLPMSSFSIRYTLDTLSISTVVPNIVGLVDGIVARTNGLLIIKRGYLYSDGSRSLYEMGRVNYNSIRTDQGARSGMTGTVAGTRLLSNPSPKSVSLPSPSIRSYDGSKRRFTCKVDPSVRPSDTISINSETIVAGEVTIAVNVRNETMTITEA